MTSHTSPTPTIDAYDDSASRAIEQPTLKTRVCRYFSRTGYCRAGNECPFLHDDTRPPGAVKSIRHEMVEPSSSGAVPGEDGMIQDRRQAVTQPPASRVVPRPVPQAQTQNPREYQMGQMRRRFSPKESKQSASDLWGIEEGTLLKFSLKPSDPDFPFEMTALECSLSVPNLYPNSRPKLRVDNKDIPRGFATNVEAGYDGLVEEMSNATLLELMKALDKNLETFLSAPKAETVKIVPNKDTRHLSALPSRSVEPTSVPARSDAANASTYDVNNLTTDTVKQTVNFTAEQKTEASKKRDVETRQLEVRMGRLPLFKKSSDGIAYTIPIEPRKPAELPLLLRAVKVVQLFVPMLYPLEPCRVKLEGFDAGAAESVEKGFELKVVSQKQTSLMGHINYLAQNMHQLAKTRRNPEPLPFTRAIQSPPEPTTQSVVKGKELEGTQDAERRSHIHHITRPVEWTIVDTGDASELDSEDVYSYDTEDGSSDGAGGVEVSPGDAQVSQQPAQNPEKGTAISFPFIELYGIELLEVITLNISVKCERCKDVTEIKGLKNGIPKSESCKKCASALSVGFRRDLVHAHAVRAGFLDLEGCIVGDMLPSTFIPTCSQCSTLYPAPGIVSVQGETTSNVCRECHQRFTFKIPSVKFLRISSVDRLPPAAGPRRKKETLGITPGTELPQRGRCKHYTKSYRWFRFSCCQKVYACDKCHDKVEEHPSEWANRMICGYCSREQNYRSEDCGVCHGVLVGKSGRGGFWEGGKGTRDRVRMSRKDKRKFRRPGGAAKKVE